MMNENIFMDLSEQDAEGQARVTAFRKGLQELGWHEGRNVKFDIRWAAGDPTRMQRYAAELVGLAPEVVMNGGLPRFQGIPLWIFSNRRKAVMAAIKIKDLADSVELDRQAMTTIVGGARDS